MKIRALINVREEKDIPAWLQWRITQPYSYLRAFGWDARSCYRNIGQQLEPLDIFVLPRVIAVQNDYEKTYKWIQDIKAQGTKVVYEADDDIWSYSYVSNLSQVSAEINKATEPLHINIILNELTQRTKDALWTLSLCDAVTVSTSALGAYVKTLTNVPVYVVPNALDIEKFSGGLDSNSIAQNSNYTTIGWAGGRRAPSDLSLMLEAWAKIEEKYSTARFVVSGWMPLELENNEKLKAKTVHNKWLPTNEYARGMQVDIGCCAVNDTGFSSRKSPIKSWEYAIAGAAVLASKTVYEKEPIIPVVDNVDDWILLLSHYIENPSHRHTDRNIFQKHVKDYHDLSTEYFTWIDAYRQIVEQGKEQTLELAR